MEKNSARIFPWIPISIAGVLILIVGLVFILFRNQKSTEQPRKAPEKITVSGFPIAQKVDSSTSLQRDYSHIYSTILSYKQKTNAYPASLADLIPTYISKSQQAIIHDTGLSYSLLTNGNDFALCTTELIKGQKYCQKSADGKAAK